MKTATIVIADFTKKQNRQHYCKNIYKRKSALNKNIIISQTRANEEWNGNDHREILISICDLVAVGK